MPFLWNLLLILWEGFEKWKSSLFLVLPPCLSSLAKIVSMSYFLTLEYLKYINFTLPPIFSGFPVFLLYTISLAQYIDWVSKTLNNWIYTLHPIKSWTVLSESISYCRPLTTSVLLENLIPNNMITLVASGIKVFRHYTFKKWIPENIQQNNCVFHNIH